MGISDAAQDMLRDTELITSDGRVYIRFPPWVIGMFFVFLSAGVAIQGLTLWQHIGMPAHEGSIRNIQVMDRRLKHLEDAVQETRLIVGLAFRDEASRVEKVYRNLRNGDDGDPDGMDGEFEWRRGSRD